MLRCDTHMTPTLKEGVCVCVWGGGCRLGKNGMLSDVERWRFSECSGGPIFLLLLKKVGFLS